MAKLWSAILVATLGLAGLGWHLYREHRRNVELHDRAVAAEKAAEDARDLEALAAAAHVRVTLFDCDTKYREQSDWGEYCRRELRALAEAEKRAAQ